MRGKHKGLIGLLAAAALVGFFAWFMLAHNMPVLRPAGEVGAKEHGLLIFGLVLSAIVVVPTFALTIYIAWKYRESNSQPKKYSPDFDHSLLFEGIWWGIPIVIIGVLGVVAWDSAHSLDPFRPIASRAMPVTVQVVSLDWKWLFIYPERHVASVNLAEIPVNTPVDFEVTSDTIMNSFWVPQLGGQIYAMPGMITQLHEMATRQGDFLGSPANIAGKGFSRMDFTVRAVTPATYASWLKTAAASPQKLTVSNYEKLAKPSDNVPVTYYSAVPNGFQQAIAMQYMMPGMSLASQLGANGNMSSDGGTSAKKAPPVQNQTRSTPKPMPSMNMNGMKM